MTKQEIINAINATIVANGAKGITAESLNNILTEMVNATPEGGSGGGGDGLQKIYYPDAMLGMMFTELGGFNMDNWAIIKAEYVQYEEIMPGVTAVLNELEVVYQEYIEANALLYQTVLEKAQNKEGLAILIDMSKAMSLAYYLMGEEDADVSFSYISGIAVMPDINGENLEMSVVHTGVMSEVYGAAAVLNADGTLTFDAGSKLFLSIPVNNSVLKEEQIISNNNFASYLYSIWGSDKKISDIKVQCFNGSSTLFQFSLNILSIDVQETTFTATYFEGIELKQIVIDTTAGTTTVTTLGTLTTA